MKAAEFEEKEYEGFLYHQLETSRANVWSPGQVFERHIGIDRAMFIRSPRVWRKLGRTMATGAVLSHYKWDYIWHYKERRLLPDFRLNLFIQAKRPMEIRRMPKHIRKAGLTPPGWCFDVEKHQQQALERLASNIGHRAAIVYAAPAFHTLAQLFAHARKGTIVEDSTFPDVSRLHRHSRWFYNRPGGNGVANPEPEPSDGPNLDEIIEKLLFAVPSGEESDASRNLAMLSKTILTALQDDSSFKENPRVAIFFQELRNIERELAEVELPQDDVRNFSCISTFAEIFNVEWFTIA